MEILEIRHSLAHILAQAVQRMINPNVKLGIGPSIDTGFYYDFLDLEIKEEDLKELNKIMQKITKENQNFIKINSDYKLAKEIIWILWENFKIELLEEFKQKWETDFSFYLNTIPVVAKDKLLKDSKKWYLEKYEKITKQAIDKWWIDDKFFVTFIDMCEWPHVENSKEINWECFKLDKIAGAYRRWSEKNPMMTRIYGLAFENKDELKKYIEMMEEARKRDHRKLWKELWLFTFNEDVWLGLPLWMPNWAILFKIIEKFWDEAHLENWYEFVRTPHIWNKKLREISWHWWFYSESMYPPMEAGQTLQDQKEWKKIEESEQYLLKPMNCPFHVEIYNAEPKSYRELPIRRCETWTVYRFEKKWQLSWLTRVRWFTQDDAHIICRKNQVEDELQRVVKFILFIYESFWFKKEDVKVYLSLRDPINKEKYAWNDEWRKFTQDLLKKVADDMKLDYVTEQWEAAFYGPKLDFKVKDCLGRERQCSTLQFDFNLPERFDMTFVNDKWEKERPYMLHRALLGSFERFIWVLIEHYAWAFPFRLAPKQIMIVPVAEAFTKYADEIYKKFKSEWIRVFVDESDDSFSKKIRNAELMKIPYTIIVGEKEESTNTLSIREYRSKKQYEIWIDEFVNKCVDESKNRE